LAARLYALGQKANEIGDWRLEIGDQSPISNLQSPTSPRRFLDPLRHGHHPAHQRHGSGAGAGESRRMLTGQIGKPAPASTPCVARSNVQGACDLGALPNVLPGYQPVTDAGQTQGRRRGLGAGRPAPEPGLTVVEMMHAASGPETARHVCHGREPDALRPRPHPCGRGAAQPGLSGRAGHLPERDGAVGARGAAGRRLAGEGWHLHQHRAPRAASASGH
jgi:hypothetical protein